MSTVAAHSRFASWTNDTIGGDETFQRFYWLITLTTLVPFISMPLLAGFHPKAEGVLAISGLLEFLGGPGHVAATAWLYGDPMPRQYFAERPIRFYWAPVALIIGVPAIYYFFPPPGPAAYITAFYSFWLYWHYQKQNWGILSFYSRVTSGEPGSKVELWAMRLAPIAGWMPSAGAVPGVAELLPGFDQGGGILAGWAIYAGVLVLFLAAVATQPGLRKSAPRLGCMIISCSFFLPALLYDDFRTAFLSFALAHGLQYQVFMAYMATSGERDAATDAPPGTVAQPRRAGVLTLLLSILLIGALLSVVGDVNLAISLGLPVMFGLAVGITMAHFVVDAGIWRLRDSFVRRYVGAAFPFLSR